MVATWLAFGLTAGVGLAGCEKAKHQQDERRAAARTEVETSYAKLGGIVAALDQPRQEMSCNDDALPDEMKGSARLCRRLALVDEGYARKLFEPGYEGDPQARRRWAWMRSGEFETFEPLGALDDGDVMKHASALDRLDKTLIGVFTGAGLGGDKNPKTYSGWLVMFDPSDASLRCQVELTLPVEQVFEPPKRRGSTSKRHGIVKFELALNRALKRVTKNFCAK